MSTTGSSPVPLAVTQPTLVSESLRRSFDDAWSHVAELRGGAALLATVADTADGDVLDHLVRGGHVWTATVDTAVWGFAVVRQRVVEGVWVNPRERRHGTARALLAALSSSREPPRDAWALPGDRATKSLYESVGWRARLLTMRGA